MDDSASGRRVVHEPGHIVWACRFAVITVKTCDSLELTLETLSCRKEK